jgi:hypothetical protein
VTHGLEIRDPESAYPGAPPDPQIPPRPSRPKENLQSRLEARADWPPVPLLLACDACGCRSWHTARDTQAVQRPGPSRPRRKGLPTHQGSMGVVLGDQAQVLALPRGIVDGAARDPALDAPAVEGELGGSLASRRKPFMPPVFSARRNAIPSASRTRRRWTETPARGAPEARLQAARLPPSASGSEGRTIPRSGNANLSNPRSRCRERVPGAWYWARSKTDDRSPGCDAVFPANGCDRVARRRGHEYVGWRRRVIRRPR